MRVFALPPPAFGLLLQAAPAGWARPQNLQLFFISSRPVVANK